MKKLLMLSLAILIATAATAQEKPKEKEPPKAASKEYSAAFCGGWQRARELEAQRIVGWRNVMLQAMSPPDKGDTPTSAVARLVIDSVSVYVAVPPIPGKLFIEESNTEVECPSILSPGK